MSKTTAFLVVVSLFAPLGWWYVYITPRTIPPPYAQQFDPLFVIAATLTSFSLITYPLGALLALEWLFIFVFRLSSDLRMRTRMVSKNRWLSRAELKHQGLSGGTIIFEQHVAALKARAWWTKDDVMALAPVLPTPQQDTPDADLLSPLDEWITQKYLDPDQGSAMLLSVWFDRNLNAIQKRFPKPQIVQCHSFFERTAEVLEFEKQWREKKAETAAGKV